MIPPNLNCTQIPPIDPSRSDEGRIQWVDSIGGHDYLNFQFLDHTTSYGSQIHLNVAPIIETVELIQKFKKGSLYLLFALWRCVKPEMSCLVRLIPRVLKIPPFCADSVDFIQKDNTWSALLGDFEQFAEFVLVTEVL